MEYSFTKEEILKAIDYLDQHPEEFKGRASSTYDLVYEGKKYPPILVLSKANELKEGKTLTLEDFKNNAHDAFKYLKQYEFSIVPKRVSIDKNNFKNWLTKNLNDKSGAVGSYLTSIDWLSDKYYEYKRINKSTLYAINDIDLIDDLYQEAVKIQRDPNSYIYNLNATSYGNKGFYSAALKKFKEFLIENMDLESDNTPMSDLINQKNSPNNSFTLPIFLEHLSQAHLQFNENLIKRFVGSLITKPFVILTGLAGSGKTKLAQSFIQWICESEDQYKIVPVGADWINREPLLGYPNGLKDTEYVTPDNGVLQLIIDAAKEENQEKPYFLLLDEMNLSHVERYFADFLSIMESNDSIKLYTGSERTSTNGVEIPQNIFWPKNLFIVGTVNIDETTYMFSPKVLDRANVIEFRLDDKDLSDFLSNPKKVDLSELITQGTSMASSFLALAQATDTAPNENLNATLVQFFKELKTIGAEFGYRSAFEIHLLFAQLSQIDANLTMDEKIDFAVMQKLLPKLHGSRSKIVTSLEALMKLCLVDTTNFNSSKLDEIEESNIKYKVSFEKLKRMYFNALNNGFTSYAEA